MPDSRLSITALINGPLPLCPFPSPTLPHSTTSTTTTTPASPSRTSTPPQHPSPPQPTWTSSQLPLPPLRVPSTPYIDPPAPRSPQTVIVKTPRGKRHRCTFRGCGRDFTRLSNLKAHWRRHSGEEPYACMHCTRKFKWRSSLKSHELGCVYEFSKAGSGLRWVYVATEQQRQQQATAEVAQGRDMGGMQKLVAADGQGRGYEVGFAGRYDRGGVLSGSVEGSGFV